MKMKKAIKKIMALSTGAAMLGATMFGAMAADLANYPSPLFVKDGVFDGVLVVGDSAAAEDVIGVANIAASLQAVSVKKKVVETGGVTVDVEGDAKKIGTSSNFLEIGEGLSSAGLTTVDSNDLAALKDGTFQNSRGTYTFTQSVDLPTASVQWTKDTDQSDDPALYLKFDANTKAYEYKVTFTPAMESEIDSSSNLKDIRDKTLSFLGKDYSVVTAKNESNQITLTLFSGAVTDILAEGSSKSYTIKGKEYDVAATYISSSEALFTVNGETSDKLAEGDTYKLADGTEIGVRDILDQNYAGESTGGDKVQFSLGANKVKIVESTPSTAADYQAVVTVGNEDLSNVAAEIQYTYSSSVAKISQLLFKYTPTSPLYVPVDGKLSTVADDEEGEAGNVIFGGFDIEFKGVTQGTTETIKVEPFNTYTYKLVFTNRNGQEYDTPMWYATGTSSNVLLGEYDGSTTKDLVITEGTAIDDEDYFLISPSATQKSHIMQFKSVNTNDATFKIKDVANNGGTIEGNNNTAFVVDGTSYLAYFTGTGSTADLFVDLNGNGSIGSNDVTDIYTRYSGSDGKIVIARYQNSNFTANFTKFVAEKTEDKPSADVQENINWTLAWAGSGVDKLKLSGTASAISSAVAGVAVGSLDGNMEKLEDKDVYEGWTYYGMFASYDYSNADQPSFEFSYPDSQAQAMVYMTSGATTSTEGSTGATYTEVVQKIDVGAIKLASEVTSPSAHNLIMVGGPCANAVARQVMGATSATCTEGFEPGKAMIKLYEHAPGKVAMLVAGYGALDTRRAANVVANYKDYAASLTGSEVVVTTVTDKVTLAAPTPKTVMEEETPATE